ncbi:hypothetical protein KIN20_018454 [Parelaphostrongylus tenuis]|uniref:tRNA-uridine aminocarboxypropyltransferase 1 n=1 Tax=Parelaphostrongylus tenuis TaxID=148309 RepID=A0AAD5N3Q8_PARTN|nr:hypothetical protein KIN20_018454 [Parelaphostrongylus tenuis]
MSVMTISACNLSSYSPLEGLTKQRCVGCGRNRMYFCYDCRIVLPGVSSPIVKLPCNVDVIKHPMEKNSKSSAIHCKILAPAQTRIFDVPDVFDYRKEDKQSHKGSNVVVFPSSSAISIKEFVKTKGPIKRFIVLDCTWFQVNTMQKIPQIQGLPFVSLTKYHTAFWRPQRNVSRGGLATIEAIYYALREYQEYGLQRPYKGEFDDLLYWFFHTRQHVDKKNEEHRSRKLAASGLLWESSPNTSFSS